MKYKSLLLVLLILCGCATLNKTIIESTDRSFFQPLVLIPDYDIYEIRIDLIRQTTEEKVNDSTSENVEIPYHPFGFHLGNGLYLDLNDNLSLLVPKLLDVNCDEDFTIKQSNQGYLFKRTTIYEKSEGLFTTKKEGLINTKKHKKISDSHSVLFVKEGLFSKYKIIESDSSVTYQSGLVKTTIVKNDEGYSYKTLLGRKEYRQFDNEVFIGKRYIVRNQGDAIEIIALGLLKSEYLKYRIIKTDNRIYVYDSNYRGFEIIRTENEIRVMNNKRNLNSYSIE